MKENNTLDESQVYEIGYHVFPSIPEEKLGEVASKLGHAINANGGSIISEEFPKIRALSYEIKKRIEAKVSKFSKAYFGWIKFEMPSTAVSKIKEEAQNNGDILRFIIVKTARENTMSVLKAPMVSRENSKEEAPKAPQEKTESSEAEIDRSIDELLVDEKIIN
jgi:ribosomal protein S6